MTHPMSWLEPIFHICIKNQKQCNKRNGGAIQPLSAYGLIFTLALNKEGAKTLYSKTSKAFWIKRDK